MKEIDVETVHSWLRRQPDPDEAADHLLSKGTIKRWARRELVVPNEKSGVPAVRIAVYTLFYTDDAQPTLCSDCLVHLGLEEHAHFVLREYAYGRRGTVTDDQKAILEEVLREIEGR